MSLRIVFMGTPDFSVPVLEALEALFSATTLTGFLAALIGGAKKLKDVLTARTAIREKIKKLEISL